ncbi:hypothetical protein [Saccharomonospora saliphila]|uniref:hypothetical protein n=1 Tax=Saccharomonospora saliphila TaxID=369829 RepID=UPI00039A9166|nr:hypothetical protein [Saccharomonospora saliphila]
MSSTFVPRAPGRARRVLLAGSSAALTVSAHTMGGGHLPDLVSTVGLAVVIGWASTAAAEHVRGVLGVLAVLGGAQVLAHGVLSHLSGHVADGPAMLALHAVATVITAVLLARAEAMLATAIHVVGTLFGLFVVRLRPPSGWTLAPGRVAASPTGGHAVEVLLRRAHPLRGPPPHS